jgi:hypothetical protein
VATPSVSVGEVQSAAATVGPPASGDGPRAELSRWRRFTDELYPRVSSGPLRLVVAAWCVVGLVVATGVNLLRTGGHGALDTIWIEDCITFLNDAYNKRFSDVIFHPESGYYQILPKSLAQIASVLPVGLAANALALQAAAVWGLVAVIAFVASRPYLPTWWLRLLVAAPVVLVPLGHTQADNDVATLHFPLLYGLFWVLMWQPVTKVGKIVAIVFAAVAATSSILAVAFLPLALLRLVTLRSWANRTVSIVYLAGMSLQLGALALGVSVRDAGHPHYNPFWALKEYFVTALPRSVFGEKWLGGPKVDVTGTPTAAYGTVTTVQLVLIVAALAILLAVVVCGRLGITRPHWPLALVATVFGMATFCESIMSMGVVQPRYAIPAALLLFVAVVATLRPNSAMAKIEPTPSTQPSTPTQPSPSDQAAGAGGKRPRWSTSAAPIAAFTVLLAVACIANYRVQNARATSPSWDKTVAEASHYCRNWRPDSPFYFYGYQWWNMQIPCNRFR